MFMEPAFAYDLKTLQTITGAEAILGDYAGEITGIATLSDAGPQQLSFLGNPKYRGQLVTTQSGVVIVPAEATDRPRAGQAYLKHAQPSLALARLCEHIETNSRPEPETGIHPTAVVDDRSVVNPEASIGPYCVIEAGASVAAGVHLHAGVTVGHGCSIAEDCTLYPNVTLYPRTRLGARVTLHAGVVVGSDGFGYEFSDGSHVKVPQIGHVVIQDDVEVGANTTIDRGRFGPTVVGRGTKIDNLVQVAHNVQLGTHCILCAQAGVSGSTQLGDRVTLAGQVGIAGHLHLAEGTIIGAQGGVHKNTQPNTMYRGTPALEGALANRSDVLHKRLPELYRRLQALEARLGQGPVV
jgi:UDP-3-O-[3-hydroxymyristoyl] glucosamine N-acyltransferase